MEARIYATHAGCNGIEVCERRATAGRVLLAALQLGLTNLALDQPRRRACRRAGPPAPMSASPLVGYPQVRLSAHS